MENRSHSLVLKEKEEENDDGPNGEQPASTRLKRNQESQRHQGTSSQLPEAKEDNFTQSYYREEILQKRPPPLARESIRAIEKRKESQVGHLKDKKKLS